MRAKPELWYQLFQSSIKKQNNVYRKLTHFYNYWYYMYTMDTCSIL